MNDPISDMIIRIKNAGAAKKQSLSFPYSRLKMDICSVLEKRGFIEGVARKGKKTKLIEVTLLSDSQRIAGVKRISKPSRRVYKKADELHRVKRGYGALILSTPKGVMADQDARKARVGGEALFEIW